MRPWRLFWIFVERGDTKSDGFTAASVRDERASAVTAEMRRLPGEDSYELRRSSPCSHLNSDRFTDAEVLKAAAWALRHVLHEQCLGAELRRSTL